MPAVAAAAPSPGSALGMSKLKMAAIGIGALLFVVGGGFGFYHFYTHPSVYLVNVTGKDGVSIFIDGKPLAQNLKNAVNESFSLVSVQSVGAGKHKVEAKDAGGKVLESFDFVFETGLGNNYLYSPARDPRVCFIVQTDEYKSSTTAPSLVTDHFKKLDPGKTIWKVPEAIDYWFKDSPDSVTIKQKKGTSSKNVVKRSLRQAACDDQNFQD